MRFVSIGRGPMLWRNGKERDRAIGNPKYLAAAFSWGSVALDACDLAQIRPGPDRRL